MTTPHTLDSTATTAAEETPPPGFAAELAALRARLREVEATLGLPPRPGQPTPPDLPALRRRVAALERRLGVVPGLAPLPGCADAAASARATTITSEPAGREPAWRARGRAALTAAMLLAALAWLLHPLPGGPGYFAPPAATARPAAARAATPAAIPAAAPAPDYRVSPPNEEDPIGPGEFDPPDNGPAGGAPPPRDGSHNQGPW